MLESAIAVGLSQLMRKETFTDPAAKPAGPAAKPAANAAAKEKTPEEKKLDQAGKFALAFMVLWGVLNIIFNSWIASIAYRCNGNSIVQAIFAFFCPIIYLVLHAVYDFRCDRFVPAMTGGRGRR